MWLKQLRRNIRLTVHEEPWDKATSPTHCPQGEEYREYMYPISHDIFDEPENEACRMLLSRIEYDLFQLLAMNDSLAKEQNTDPYSMEPVLYWRVEPELATHEYFGDDFTCIYARYAMAMRKRQDG